ncbi:hypothetical protein, partial [Streptomyces xiaopingdaonensis]|uniref:hypothetical protein n=1 Tax=Streptomyces xiaopingdaonensis TaxID=1565415 RepID=UPI0005259322
MCSKSATLAGFLATGVLTLGLAAPLAAAQPTWPGTPSNVTVLGAGLDSPAGEGPNLVSGEGPNAAVAEGEGPNFAVLDGEGPNSASG